MYHSRGHGSPLTPISWPARQDVTCALRSAILSGAHEEFLEPTIIASILDGMFPHWPDNLRQGIRADFLRKLNDAESGYSKCTELISKEQMFTGNSVFTTFARNVTLLLGHENLNPEVF